MNLDKKASARLKRAGQLLSEITAGRDRAKLLLSQIKSCGIFGHMAFDNGNTEEGLRYTEEAQKHLAEVEALQASVAALHQELEAMTS